MDENKPKPSDIIMKFQNTRNKEILKALIKEKKNIKKISNQKGFNFLIVMLEAGRQWEEKCL